MGFSTRAPETTFDAIMGIIQRANHELARKDIRDARITIELPPEYWWEFKRTLAWEFMPNIMDYQSGPLKEVKIYGHKVKAYYPKRTDRT